MAWQKPRFERFDRENPLQPDADPDCSPKRLYYFRLVAANGEIVAQSEAYNSAQARDHGIEAVRRAAELAKVVDV